MNVPPPPSAGTMLRYRVTTIVGLIRHFTHRNRIFMLPLLLFLLVTAVLLVLTSGLSYVAPFVYAIF
jgi:hypothetical protein